MNAFTTSLKFTGFPPVLSTKVSVIIPAYNQAKYIAESVQSVLAQTYSNLEVIVVNDASTDETDRVINQFDDPRLKYIVHKKNRYAAAARNTGIRASTGELLAFLDADDRYHPEKIQKQVYLLNQNPEIGVAYNSRIEINESGLPLSIVQAPRVVNLSDLVMIYPFAPSEVVMRKEWAYRVGLFDESFVLSAEDPDFFRRLALRGCKMAGVDRVLNFRRLHVGRVNRNLGGTVDDHRRALENAFGDPRCPPEVLTLRERSLGALYMILSYDALNQNETSLGQDLIRKAIEFDQSILNIETNDFLEFLIMSSIRDGGDHESSLRRVITQLPKELERITCDTEHAIAVGYFLRGVLDIIWGRTEQGSRKLEKANSLGILKEENYFQYLFSQLLLFNKEFGDEATETVFQNLSIYLPYTKTRKDVSLLKGSYLVNKAFEQYQQGQYTKAIQNTLQAFVRVPSYLANRGLIAIFIRSMIGAIEGNSHLQSEIVPAKGLIVDESKRR